MDLATRISTGDPYFFIQRLLCKIPIMQQRLPVWSIPLLPPAFDNLADGREE